MRAQYYVSTLTYVYALILYRYKKKVYVYQHNIIFKFIQYILHKTNNKNNSNSVDMLVLLDVCVSTMYFIFLSIILDFQFST